MVMKNFTIVFIREAKWISKKNVDLTIVKMQLRADELGKELTKKQQSNLIGCRKIKFKKMGNRIVYRIVGDTAEIAEIISVGKREESAVYINATKRLHI